MKHFLENLNQVYENIFRKLNLILMVSCVSGNKHLMRAETVFLPERRI
jgi:hypothetical protein